jgi:hypothetical protein
MTSLSFIYFRSVFASFPQAPGALAQRAASQREMRSAALGSLVAICFESLEKVFAHTLLRGGRLELAALPIRVQ